jgi:hypothetical protein
MPVIFSTLSGKVRRQRFMNLRCEATLLLVASPSLSWQVPTCLPLTMKIDRGAALEQATARTRISLIVVIFG